MHPTIDEQLTGALRLLDQLMEETNMPTGSVEKLTNVRRLLRHVERSWAVLPAFHRADNDALNALLASLRGGVTPSTAREIGRMIDAPASESSDSTTEAQRNTRLRELLTRVIRELPIPESERFARRAIARQLLQRIQSDPS